MEHIESRKIIYLRAIFFCCVISIISCKSEDPNPELSDPIYKFLVDQGNALKPALEAEKKKLEEAQIAYDKLEVNTAEKKQALKELRQIMGKVARLTQEVEYNDIRRERRLVEGRRDYKIAYQKGEPWPPKEEFESFMTQQRLRSASRNWADRVPRLHDRILAAWPKPDPKAKEKAKESGGGEGEPAAKSGH